MENTVKHDPAKAEYPAKHDPAKHDPAKHDPAKADAAAAQPEAEKEPELTQAEKDAILREAVSWYLRNDFRDKNIRKVCEEYIAGVDKAARAAVETGTQQPKSETLKK